jgi:hypothetical protein
MRDFSGFVGRRSNRCVKIYKNRDMQASIAAERIFAIRNSNIYARLYVGVMQKTYATLFTY